MPIWVGSPQILTLFSGNGFSVLFAVGILTALVLGISLLTLQRRARAYQMPGPEGISASTLLWLVGFGACMLFWIGTVSSRLDLGADKTLEVSSESLMEQGTFEPVVPPEHKDVPFWVFEEPFVSEKSVYLVIHSPQMTTRDEAEAAAMEKAKQIIREDFHRFHPSQEEWSIPEEVVEEKAIIHRYINRTDIDFGGSTGIRPMYQIFVQLKLSPELRHELLPQWRKSVVRERSDILMHLAILLGITLASVSVVLRTETHRSSRQQVAGWKFLAAAITLGSILISAFLLR